MTHHFDVIVVGVGSMGSATCFYLAQQGVNVLGLEQFHIPHENGSHTGQSRIIRKAYFEHPDYVRLLQKAYGNWEHLEQITSQKVFYPTGLLYLAPPNSSVVQGVQYAAQKFSIPLHSLSSDTVTQNYPQLNIPSHYKTLFEPNAGFVTPEKAIRLYYEQAVINGATILSNTPVLNWKQTNDTIIVETEQGNYQCNKLIFTSGAWTSQLIPSLSPSLQVTKQVLAWVKPKNSLSYELGRFPCWMLVDDSKPGLFYGFPMLSPRDCDSPLGLKLAYHYRGESIDPNEMNQTFTQDDESILTDLLNTYFVDGYDSTIMLKTCLYTNSPDENFIIDYLPDTNNQVILAAGFSGHGFKFASVIGDILSQMAITNTCSLPIEFLNLHRFTS